ncbi:hypothetical protein K0U83_12155 [bacterium]|nr:hypothetical protein [bacterium]
MTTETTTTVDTVAAPATTQTTAAPAVAAAPATTTTAVETTSTETTTATEAAPAPQGAPEKYEFKPTPGIALTDTTLESFAAEAKALNLPQDKAQALLDSIAPQLAKQQVDTFKATVQGWQDATKADPEIGGDKLPQNLAHAQKAAETYFDADFNKLLKDSGLGNHPAMVRGLAKIGRTLASDTFIPGGSGDASTISAAQKLYGPKA